MGASVVNKSAQVISASQEARWKEVSGKLSRHGWDDVYFQLPYIRLYVPDKQIEAFIYEKDRDFFFLPYIKYRVPSQLTKEELWDMETPYGYSGPFSTTEDTGFLSEAWKSLTDHCRKSNIIAGFMRFHSLLKNQRLAEILPYQTVTFSNKIVTLDLNQSEEDVVAHYEQATRNKVSKSKRKGVTVTSSNTWQDMQTFSKLYYATMDQIGANERYYFDKEYFRGIHNHLRDYFRIFIARVDEMPIGGILVFHSKNYAYVHLSANIKEHRSYEPASLLRHETILSYLNSGRKHMIFGGGNSSDPKDSLFVFKKGFSSETADFFVGKWIFDKDKFEMVCKKWEDQNPNKLNMHKNYFFKYKF